MPLYTIEHIIPISEEQKDEIADSITRFHSETFTTPRLFVNVQFMDIAAIPTYVGGKRRKGNRIIANVRSGGNRTNDQWDTVCDSINKMWAKVIGSSGEQDLRAIFVLGGMIAGSEVGFSIPGPGEDAKWLKDNMTAFKKKAADGDEDFQDMIEELRSRDVFKGIVDGTQVNGH